MKTAFDKYDVLFSNETFMVHASSSQITQEEKDQLASIVQISMKVSHTGADNRSSMQLHTFHIPKEIAIKAKVWNEQKNSPACYPNYPAPKSTEDLLISILENLGVQFED